MLKKIGCFFYESFLALFLLRNLFSFRKRSNLLQRLGFQSYPIRDKHVTWIHAVSVGETNAAKILIDKIKKEDPGSVIVLSSLTEAGHEAAKKTEADYKVFIPFDFTFSVSRVLKKVLPKKIIFIETDFWFNFIRIGKKFGAKIYLVSGKISKRSYKRLVRFSPFAKNVFSYFYHIGVQNKEYFERFKPFADQKKLSVTGNLKLENRPHTPSIEEKKEWKKKLGISKTDKVITIASTHPPEDEILLSALYPLLIKNDFKILLAPRHPEKFTPFKNYSFIKLSEINKTSNENLIIIDSIGSLIKCYAVSDLAIVGGSFIPHIGGHNILEPVYLQTPVFFGPYMENQNELKDLVLKQKCGKLSTDILIDVENYFSKNPSELTLNCKSFSEKRNTILLQTYQIIT